MKLTNDELRAVLLPGSERLVSFWGLWRPGAPVTSVRVDADDRADLRACLDGERDVYLDATAHGLRVGPVDAEGETPFSDVVAGHMVNARLLCAVLDALPRGPVEIVWRGRLEPLTLHAVEGPPHVRDAVVMPMRCCSCVTADHGTFHVGSVRLSCGCRDCAAGRQWGW